MPRSNRDPVESAVASMRRLIRLVDSMDESTLTRLSTRVAEAADSDGPPAHTIMSGITLLFLVLRHLGFPPAFFTEGHKRLNELLAEREVGQ